MSKKVIVFQGDSITDAGRSRDPQEPNAGLGGGYAALAAARLLADHPKQGLQIHNRGISGNRVVDLYARWKVDTLNLRPDILSILIGVNDSWHGFNHNNGVEVDRYAQFYRMLLEWTLKELPKVKIVLIDPFVLPIGAVSPEWLPEIEARGQAVQRLAADFGLTRISAQAIFDEAAEKAPLEYWLRDGVHPTLAGHQLLCDAWIAAAADLF